MELAIYSSPCAADISVCATVLFVVLLPFVLKMYASRQSAAAAVSRVVEPCKLDNEILRHLNENPASTAKILTRLIGGSVTKHDINSRLYTLLSQHKVRRDTTINNAWCLA
jgi:hypothetical protein